MSSGEPLAPIQRLIRRGVDAVHSDEFGVRLRRLLPWQAVADTKRAISELGVIWVLVEPDKQVAEHRHDEEEAFFVTSGTIEVTLEGETTVLAAGDMIYIPRFARHSLVNRSKDTSCRFIDVYWDNQGRDPPAPP
jgi:quercetin dioxygenase-like cupin family protein